MLLLVNSGAVFSQEPARTEEDFKREAAIADFTRKQERSGLATRFHAGGSSLSELAALIADAGFVQVDVEEMRPPRFSAFPGAGFVRAYKSADAYAINESAG